MPIKISIQDQMICVDDMDLCMMAIARSIRVTKGIFPVSDIVRIILAEVPRHLSAGMKRVLVMCEYRVRFAQTQVQQAVRKCSSHAIWRLIRSRDGQQATPFTLVIKATAFELLGLYPRVTA